VTRVPTESERKWTRSEGLSFSLPREAIRVAGREGFVMRPPGERAKPTPWVWYAPVLAAGMPDGMESWMFQKFLAAGVAIAGIDVGESYGSPEGRAFFTAFRDTLVTSHGLSLEPCLLARSRGALMLYNWAVEHPESVACIAGIYPVCDVRTYPGLDKACGAYGLTEAQLAAQLLDHNPVDRLLPLAKACVPIFHIHGDEDTVVPLEPNSAAVAGRYRSMGGDMTLVVPRGQGHNYWPGFFESEELIAFVLRHAKAG
jgi:predicted esterase